MKKFHQKNQKFVKEHSNLSSKTKSPNKNLFKKIAPYILAGTIAISGSYTAGLLKGEKSTTDIPYTVDVDCNNTPLFKKAMNLAFNELYENLRTVDTLEKQKANENISPEEEEKLEQAYNFLKENFPNENDLRTKTQLLVLKSMVINGLNLDIEELQMENHVTGYVEGYPNSKCTISITDRNGKKIEFDIPDYRFPPLDEIDPSRASHIYYNSGTNTYNSKQAIEDLKSVCKQLEEAEMPPSEYFPSECISEPNQNAILSYELEKYLEKDSKQFSIADFEELNNLTIESQNNNKESESPER